MTPMWELQGALRQAVCLNKCKFYLQRVSDRFQSQITGTLTNQSICLHKNTSPFMIVLP